MEYRKATHASIEQFGVGLIPIRAGVPLITLGHIQIPVYASASVRHVLPQIAMSHLEARLVVIAEVRTGVVFPV